MMLIIAVLMLGLGLALTVDDFRRVRHHRPTIAVALVCQLLILPIACFGIVTLFALPPVAAVGMMLVAAAPGGPLAGLYSHLFGSDVAFNLTLTAVNSVLSVFTLTIITNLSLDHFLPDEDGIGLHGREIATIFAAVLVPIAIGMSVRTRRPELAARAERLFRIISVLGLGLFVLAGLLTNGSDLADNLTSVSPAVLVFALVSLTIGYAAGRITRAGRRVSIAAGMEIGFHNAAVSLSLALGISDDFAIAVPASIYGFAIMIIATAFGFLIRRLAPGEPAPVNRPPRPCQEHRAP
ncbi:BASS family bile acid:Na+ symporter [Actinocorallia herbida]|uniref:BASS family bile acid:Na+ symporter n=2 Tax=Actinocorallia herbida TaxID=58109 RepID=A0A3N1CWA2_9ACTN|nr:BASS family bile acid:Na+ symporter [Actinocorallia herbida]